jgi:hypothetical protein
MMRRLLIGTREVAVRFCERCAEVCDDRYRRRTPLQQMWLGLRI